MPSRSCLRVLLLALSIVAPAVTYADDTPCTVRTLYSNDFESDTGLADWSTGTLATGGNSWYGVQECFRPHSGIRVFRFGGPSCSDGYSKIELAYAQPGGDDGIEVPAGSRLARLSFWHKRSFEPLYDGGTLSLSLDGASYSFIPGSAIVGGTTYNTTLNSFCAPPEAMGREAFTGGTADFEQTLVDLDAACDIASGTGEGCAGQSVRVGFTGVSDCSVTSNGWTLDDVVITACVPTVLPSTPTDFHTLEPCRVVDTRLAAGPLGGPALPPYTERPFPIAGACGIPPTAVAVALNVTVVSQGAFGGYAQVYPADQGYPLTSLLNFGAGETRSNNAIVPLATDASGAVKARVATDQAVHLVLDVVGYFL